MSDNNSKERPQVKSHRGCLITFNVVLPIVLILALIWLVAYTPLVQKKEFDVKLVEFLKDTPYNTTQLKTDLKDKLLTFLKTNQYEPSRSAKRFKDNLFAFLIKSGRNPSLSKEDFKMILLDFLRKERALLDISELKDARKESRHDWVIARTLLAMCAGGAIGGTLCNLCGANLIASLKNNRTNSLQSEIDFNDKLLDFVKKDRNKETDPQKAFKEELLNFLKDNQYEPSQTYEKFKEKLNIFLNNNPYKSSQSEEEYKEFKNKLLDFLRDNQNDPSPIGIYLRPLTGAITGLVVFFVGNLLVTSLSIDATQKGWETLEGRLPYVAIAILAGYAAPEFMHRLKEVAKTMFSETDRK